MDKVRITAFFYLELIFSILAKIQKYIFRFSSNFFFCSYKASDLD